MRPVNWSNPINYNHGLNKGLVGWWLVVPHWKGGTRLRDLTNRSHGTLNSMDPSSDWITPGDRPGGFGALDFDGTDDFVEVQDGFEPTGTQMTISFWAFQNSLSADRGILTKGVFTSNWAWIIRVPTINTALRLHFPDATNNTGNIYNEFQGVWAANQWIHITVAYNGNESVNADRVRLYMDGIERTVSVTAGTLTTSLPDSDQEMDIGRLDGFGSTWNGRLDDLRIWNRTLNAAEISEYYDLSRSSYYGLLNRRSGLRAIAPAAATVFSGGGGGFINTILLEEE